MRLTLAPLYFVSEFNEAKHKWRESLARLKPILEDMEKGPLRGIIAENIRATQRIDPAADGAQPSPVQAQQRFVISDDRYLARSAGPLRISS